MCTIRCVFGAVRGVYISCRRLFFGKRIARLHTVDERKGEIDIGKAKVNLCGKRFGRLTVLSEDENSPKGHTYWFCKCDCGKMRRVRNDKLTCGETISCGCFNRELIVIQSTKHGSCNTRLHNIWTAMKQRCNNPNSDGYQNYSGRGIRVCKEWIDSFLSFQVWALRNGYSESLTIDRINVNGNYEPSNCRWATYSEQNRNKRPYRKIKIKTASEKSKTAML
jgi:hypothetical protein